MTCRFYYNNLWDNYTLTESTEHSNFTAENTQHRDFNKAWHSNHGAGSGWGYFIIYAGGGTQNNKIDFDEGGAELTATLTASTYDADTLATEIKTQMDAAGGLTYTVSYSDSTNKFTISAGANFTLKWSTGTNASDSVADTIGFATAADDSGASTYTADEIRIHHTEAINIDLGSAQTVHAAMVRGHNFQSTATVKFQYSDDDFTTVAGSWTFTIQDDILAYQSTAGVTYRYWRITIQDVDNSDGYVEMGRIFLGPRFEPTRTFLEEMRYDPADPSIVNQSEDGQISSIQLGHYWTKNYSFIMESADKANFDTMFASPGTSKGLFITEDTSSYLSTTDYVKFNRWSYASVLYSAGYWRLDMEVEKLR